jgi:hypothetical protein
VDKLVSPNDYKLTTSGEEEEALNDDEEAMEVMMDFIRESDNYYMSPFEQRKNELILKARFRDQLAKQRAINYQTTFEERGKAVNAADKDAVDMLSDFHYFQMYLEVFDPGQFPRAR